MSNGLGTKKKTLEAKTRGALERIGELENAVQSIVTGVNGLFGQQTQRMSLVEETLSAVIEVIGVEQVQEALRTKRVRAAEEQDKALQEMLQKQIEAGEVVATDVVDEDSLIVGVETTADGTPIPPGRAQIRYSAIAPQFQEKILGLGIGGSFETQPRDGAGNDLPPGKFEVKEIYKILPPPPEAEEPATHADQTSEQE